jgi:hypothetical protein
MIVVRRCAALIWWKILAVELDWSSLRVVLGILLIWRRSTEVLRLAVWCRVYCWVVCWRIRAALRSLLRSRVSDCGVDEEADKGCAVER